MSDLDFIPTPPSTPPSIPFLTGYFYGLGFDDHARYTTVTITGVNCTVVLLTPASNLTTPSLAEPCRIEVTITGANPYIQFTLDDLPGQEKRRVVALLGLRSVSGQYWNVTDGYSTTLMQTRRESKNFAFKTYGINALMRPQSTTIGNVTVLDIGRYWLSDIAQVEGAPYSQWEDGAEDSGQFVESSGYQAIFVPGTVRETMLVPLDQMSEDEAYNGLAPDGGFITAGYASLREARRVAGLTDHVIGGLFDELHIGRSWASSDTIGAGRLIYGRLAELPTITRLGGKTFGSSLRLLETR